MCVASHPLHVNLKPTSCCGGSIVLTQGLRVELFCRPVLLRTPRFAFRMAPKRQVIKRPTAKTPKAKAKPNKQSWPVVLEKFCLRKFIVALLQALDVMIPTSLKPLRLATTHSGPLVRTKADRARLSISQFPVVRAQERHAFHRRQAHSRMGCQKHSDMTAVPLETAHWLT